MLSTGGQGMLLNAVHPCWIVQVPRIGEQRSGRRTVESPVVVFKISPSENFSPPPSTTTRSCPHPEYICIVKLLYTASLPELLAQFLATVNAAAGGRSQLLPVCT